MDCSLPGSSVHGDSPVKNIGVGCYALLQGIFPAQGSNPDLPHCRWILYWLNHQGSPLGVFCAVLCLVTQSCPTLCDPMDCKPARLLCPWGFSRQEYWSGLPCPPPGELPNPGIKPRSPALQADSLPSEPQRKPKNTGMSSLSLLQGIFPTQGSNPDLPHCRRILYQLSHQASSVTYLFLSEVSKI